jgi:hypothetical protein
MAAVVVNGRWRLVTAAVSGGTMLASTPVMFATTISATAFWPHIASIF